MKKSHQDPKHFLLSAMLDQKYWAHVYLMCDERFDTQHAINKMVDLLESKGVTLLIPVVLMTEIEIVTAGRIREIALANTRKP